LGKQFSKKRRRNARSSGSAEIIEFQGSGFKVARALPPIEPLNATQADYLAAIRTSPQVVVVGPAGTGKTWIAATCAADLYRNRQLSKIILTRPNVPCGRSLGFFPGSLQDKFAPWATPVIEAIKDRIGKAAYDIALKNGDIEMVPFEVMRGRSWKNAFVLLDEAQNTTPAEIKTFLTRVGEDCTTVINGDVSQCDLDETSGLRTVIDLIRSHMLPVPVIEFTLADIVRSGLCAMWVRAFEAAPPRARMRSKR
jgi:phosphate starvation-inducible PhoH-like protein